MTQCLRRSVSPIAVMAGIIIMGLAAPARADLEIWASTTGPATAADKVAFIASGTGFQTVSYSNAAFGAFNVAALATSSDSPGTPSVAFLAGSTVSIINNTASVATIWITIGDTGFTAPTAPPGSIVVNSHIANTVIVNNSANLESFQSYVNQDNSQNGTTSFLGSVAQTPSITGPLGSVSDNFYTIPALSSGYSITETFKITLGGNSALNFSSNTTLSLTPEPSSMAIAGLGALGLIGYGIRRRRGA